MYGLWPVEYAVNELLKGEKNARETKIHLLVESNCHTKNTFPLQKNRLTAIAEKENDI